MVNDHVPILNGHGGYPIFRPFSPAASGPGPVLIAEDHPPRKIEADLLTQPLCVQGWTPVEKPLGVTLDTHWDRIPEISLFLMGKAIGLEVAWSLQILALKQEA